MKRLLLDYALLVASIIVPTIVIAVVDTDIYSLQIVMIGPLLIAIIYFSHRKIWFATVGVLFFYTLYTFLVAGQRAEYELLYSLVGYCIIIGTAFAAKGIVNGGLRLITEERESAINEKKHRLQQQALEEASRKDPLTGLDNHKTFQRRIRSLIESGSKRELTLAIIDIDNFKSVNDTFGHSIGDMVLRKLGALLKDNEGINVFPSRYGGEEFTVIFRDCKEQAVRSMLERLRKDTEAISFPELNGRNVTVSIGCCIRSPEDTLDRWFRLADEALYLAKRTGKNKVVWNETNLFTRTEGRAGHD